VGTRDLIAQHGVQRKPTAAERPGIVYCQLNDDSSGSPRVLVHTIEALRARFAPPLAFVSSSQSGGFLGQSAVPLRRYAFRKTLKHPWLGLSFLAGQLELLFRMALSRPQRDAPVYVNTLLPVGGALYGALTRRPVVFHSHEIPATLLDRILFAITMRCSTVVICVSDTHAARLPMNPTQRKRVVILPNALDPEFASAAALEPKTPRASGKFRALYATASLSAHKGFPEFLRLAEALRERQDIELALATPLHETERIPRDLPANVRVFCGEPSLAALYRSADLLLNLSPAAVCVETFGLTVLEAMAFGTPGIVPQVGGPAELVREGVEGFQVEARDTARLVETVSRVADDPRLWRRLSAAARSRSEEFSFSAYQRRLLLALHAAIPQRAPTLPS
jgi:L-malate glycosyltransferase